VNSLLPAFCEVCGGKATKVVVSGTQFGAAFIPQKVFYACEKHVERILKHVEERRKEIARVEEIPRRAEVERKPCEVCGRRLAEYLLDYSRWGHPEWNYRACEVCMRASVRENSLLSLPTPDVHKLEVS